MSKDNTNWDVAHKEEYHNEVVASLDKEDVDVAKQHIHEAETYTESQYRRVRRKVDFIQLPLMMITYGMQFADKQSLASGVLFGLRQDTKLVGNEYANLTTFFFMAYAIFQIPMGWLGQRFPIGKVIGICVIFWGVSVMCMGAANNYAQLVGLRILLGMFESVLTPGFAILTSSWYLRSEQTIRQACYFTMTTFVAVISSVIVYFLADNAQKHGGLAAWRVINLFLGGLTIFLGILDVIVWDTPDRAWWLKPEEKKIAQARVVSNATGGGERHAWKWSQVRECFKDPQYYCFILFNILITIPNGGITTFAPLIFASFGFTPLQTVLYGLPQQAISFFFLLVGSNIVNKFPKMRFPLVIFISLFCCATLLSAALLPADAANKWPKWTLFSFSSVYGAAMYLTWPLMSINVAGRTKKTWISTTALMTFCVGNIVGSQIFRPSDAPTYHRGLIGCAVALVLVCILCVLWWGYYEYTNRRREREFLASGLSKEEQDFQRKLAGETDLTDTENVHFRYTN